ncbi:MAG: hypothetical protein GF308_13305 [Candidatus Heimdallarchaeota archaeon]|nr:hypothetical protein [Candidatus Heimdallarchaeota archaeon]
MATISGLVWFILIQGVLMVLASVVFLGIMIQNFITKKTTGTAFLAIFYGMIALTQATSVTFNIFAIINPYSLAHGTFLVLYLLVFILSYYFLYFFASRHILQDNDIMRSVVSFIYLGITLPVIGMIGYEIFFPVDNPTFVVETIEPGTNLQQFMPTTLMAAILYLTILVLVQIRIIIRMSTTLIQKKTKDELRRKGFKYILIAVVCLFLTLLLTVTFTIEGMPPAAIILVYILRAIALFAGLFLSYVGWILPNWFKRRIRKKAWIVKNYKAGKKPASQFVTSKTYFEKTQIITETSES